MKVSRIDQQGVNKDTALWIYEFAYDLDKKANNVDYLKEYIDKTYKKKKFNTIEEKLADIKERIGFDLAKKVTNELEKKSENNSSDIKLASDCGCAKECDCSKKCQCKEGEKKECSCNVKKANDATSERFKKREEKMKNIMEYIKDMIKDYKKRNLDINEVIVITACRGNTNLGFDDVNIDEGKLKQYINYEISKYGNNFSGKETYIPMADSYTDSAEDQVADYYSHGKPSLS